MAGDGGTGCAPKETRYLAPPIKPLLQTLRSDMVPETLDNITGSPSPSPQILGQRRDVGHHCGLASAPSHPTSIPNIHREQGSSPHQRPKPKWNVSGVQPAVGDGSGFRHWVEGYTGEQAAHGEDTTEEGGSQRPRSAGLWPLWQW